MRQPENLTLYKIFAQIHKSEHIEKIDKFREQFGEPKQYSYRQFVYQQRLSKLIITLDKSNNKYTVATLGEYSKADEKGGCILYCQNMTKSEVEGDVINFFTETLGDPLYSYDEDGFIFSGDMVEVRIFKVEPSRREVDVSDYMAVVLQSVLPAGRNLTKTKFYDTLISMYETYLSGSPCLEVPTR